MSEILNRNGVATAAFSNLTVENYQTANLCVQDSAPVCDVDINSLPTGEEYDRQMAPIFEWSIRRFSPPKYVCPKCGKGGMCKDETLVLTSCPPQYRYECSNPECRHVETKHY